MNALIKPDRSQDQENDGLLSLLDSAPVGIHWVNADGIIVWANRTELQMLGYESAEYIGQPITKFHVDADVIADILCTLKSGQTLESKEARLRHKNGSIRIASINSNVLWENGKFIHTRCFTRDVTDRFVLEQQRKQADDQQLENARVIDALYRLTDQLQRSDSLDDIYSAALSAILSGLRCSRAAILLSDDTGAMRFAAWRGLSESYRRAVDGHSPWARDDVSPKPVVIDDVRLAELDEALRLTVLEEGVRSLVFIPLLTDGKLIGKFMAYFDAPHAFSERNVGLSLSIARQLAFAIEHYQAQLALRENERLFREMLDVLPAAIYRTDAEGRVTYFNPAAVEFAGRVPQIGVDQWCVTWKLYGADGQPLPHHECPMAIALKEGRAVRGVEAVAERPDGTCRWFAPYPTPFKDANGRVLGAINLLLDITDRKHAEQILSNQAKQLALITDTAPVFIAYCDAESRYRFVNQPYADRFGLDAKDLVGRHLAQVLGHDTYASIMPHIATVLRGECCEFEVTVKQLSNEECFMHCSYAPEFDSDQNVIGWVAAITDISDRRQVEQALRASEAKLRDMDRRKDEFLAMLSHELRNPLAPIANAVHLLRREPTQSPVFQQARAIIERQTGRLARLVEDLLEVSRITTGRIQLQMERLAIGGVIERAIETVRPLIEQQGHKLAVAIPSDTVWVNADGARLEQVFINLLTNAAKYTDAGGTIDLSVQTHADDIVVRIKDSGIGISPELLPHVFELFMQSERALDRSQGGLGIGLALVQRLVGMHAGTVSVESSFGKGSEFTVTLPVALAPNQLRTSERPRVSDLSSCKLRVLVVDDNSDSASSLSMLIEACGHDVWTAGDGEAGIEIAVNCQPHVAFLDIGLPKLDGYALASRLRSLLKSSVQLVAITGYGRNTDRQRALEAGFDHHLVKPVDCDVVERILSEASAKVIATPPTPAIA